MDVYKKHKTFIELWEDAFLIHQDVQERDSAIVNNDNTKNYFRINNKSIKHAILCASALLLSIYKEKVIDKKDDKFNLLIDEKEFNNLITKIIKKENGKVYVDEIEFDNELMAFDFIRNKLLHGDYYIENDDIFVEKDDKEIKINFFNMTEFVLSLQQYMDYSMKSNERIIVVPSVEEKIFRLPNTKIVIDNLTSIDANMDERLNKGDFLCVKIKISKKGKRNLSLNDMTIFEQLIKTLKEIMYSRGLSFNTALELVQKREEFKPYWDYFYTNHIKMNFIIEPIKSNDKYVQIKDTVLNTNNIFYNLDKNRHGSYDIGAFLPMMENILNNNQLTITSNAIQNLIKVLYHFMLKDNYSIINDLYQTNKSITFLDDITIVTSFVSFYSEFHYGIDELFSNRRMTTLKEILNGTKLDFSKLNLKLLEDNSMTIDIKFSSLKDQGEKLKKDYEKIKEQYKKIQEQYNNCKESNNSNSDSLNRILNNLEITKKKMDELKELVDKYNAFDVKKYEDYINIIFHIRNAFAHGNVTILPYVSGDELLDRKIIIQDIHEGKLTYSKEISYNDFNSLFDFKHNKLLLKFIYNNTNDEMREFLKGNVTTLVIDPDNLIRQDKIEDWEILITDLLNNGDMLELAMVDTTYRFMGRVPSNISEKQFYELLKKYVEQCSKVSKDFYEVDLDAGMLFNTIAKYVSLEYFINCPKKVSIIESIRDKFIFIKNGLRKKL